MPSKSIILRLSNEGIFYHPNHQIPLARTNLPAEGFSFKTHYPIFCLAQQLRFAADTSTLWVTILDYQLQDTTGFSEQQPKTPFQHLAFENLDWEQLHQHFSYYQKNSFAKLLQDPIEPIPQPQPIPELIPYSEPALYLDYSFSVPISKTRFELGFVAIPRKIKEWKTETTLKVYNDFILPEFDHVKPFFAKALQTKRFHVKAKLKWWEGTLTQVSCHSREVQAINQQTIENVKHLHLKKVLEPPKVVAVDKNIFTSEDLFDHQKEAVPNALRSQEKDLFEQIMDLKGVRNRKQLEYLAGKLQTANEPLRYTLHPSFGFLFLVHGATMNHYIWELLHSHATYVWSFDKGELPPAKQYQYLQEVIQFIGSHGRQAYKRQVQPHYCHFWSVRHDNAESPLVDGFPRWRNRLEEQLV